MIKIKDLADGGLAQDVHEFMENEINKTSQSDKMVSLNKVCEMLYAMLTTQDINDYDYVTAPAYDDVVDFVEDFRKTMEE